mmetsp:Transcript_10052/g.22193  ORF Transcript_10052/g.22193 Transcript_10052/m.22193 type:complete len:589 (+) Transcript_10052:181-1947(+)
MADDDTRIACLANAAWLWEAKGFGYLLALVPTAGFATCALLMARGLLILLEGSNVTSCLATVPDGSPFQAFTILSGVVDVLAAMVGIAGLAGKVVSLVKQMWAVLLFRLTFDMLLLGLLVLEETGHVPRTARPWALFLILSATLTVEFAWTFARLALVAALQWTVSTGLAQLMINAGGLATMRHDDVCATRHLLVVILLDDTLRRMLDVAGAEVASMARRLMWEPERQAYNIGMTNFGKVEVTFKERRLLDDSLEKLLRRSLELQRLSGDQLLRAEHVLEALCESNTIIVDLGANTGMTIGFPVKSEGMRLQVEAIRSSYQVASKQFTRFGPVRSYREGGQVAPSLFGPLQLPLEETVLAYFLIRLVSAICFLVLFAINGRDVILKGFVTAPESAGMQLFLSLLAVLALTLGLYAIATHRSTRSAVQGAAVAQGASDADDLHKAFDLVRDWPIADTWLKTLRRSAAGLSVLLVWAPLELLLDLPVLGLALVESNVCGIYTAGIARISGGHFWASSGQVSLHCTSHDAWLVSSVIAYSILKLYMCWAILALWHIYAFGWTTTDIRGAAYMIFNPFQPALGFGESKPLIP